MNAEADTKKRLLIADDSPINRRILRRIFEREYDVSEAENGLQALETLRGDAHIAAVLLDILMPQLDGYGVMKTMREDARLKDIPVIVVTGCDDEESQIRALDAGAYDIMFKPVSAAVALHRVRSIIARAETHAAAEQNTLLTQQLHESEIDQKTGVFTQQAFLRNAERLLRQNPDKKYMLLRFDIDNFKLYNDAFGLAAGDELLRKLGQTCRNQAACGAVYGHFEADHFVMCMESAGVSETRLRQLLSSLELTEHHDFELLARMGVYIIENPSLPVALMCDRALLALRSIKGDYSARIAYYNDEMRLSLIEEQQIISEMAGALENRQFVVYIQPQYNQADLTLYGAEALVRWLHPDKGLIPPGKFIPIFERNGFISRLDEYILDQVCRLQRAWLDKGLNTVPVSVNISRRDIYSADLCQRITDTLKKHRIPPRLIQLEITESAYMENPRQLIDVVTQLRKAGFHMEMDDFGSGYSSLNTLKDVPVDTLKLDMKFMTEGMDNPRGGSILSSVVRMAHWLKLPVIAEGVETKKQADYLKSIGCFYIQGYYFDRPLPADEFEKRLRSRKPDLMRDRRFTEDVEGATSFLSASSQSALLFNSFVGGAGIIEFDGQNVEGLRFNDKFYTAIGISQSEYQSLQMNMHDRFDEANWQIYLSAIRQAIDTRDESVCEVQTKATEKRPPLWTRVRMRYLAQNEHRYILYLAVENIDQQTRLLRRNTLLSQQLSAVMDSVPGGILDFEVQNGHMHLTFCNGTLAAMFGYEHDEFMRLFADAPFSAMHPEDRAGLLPKAQAAYRSSTGLMVEEYRHQCKDGSYRWVRMSSKLFHREDDTCFGSGIVMDISDEIAAKRRADEQARMLRRNHVALRALYDTIPCGVMEFALEGKKAKLVSFNSTSWHIFGYARRDEFVSAVHARDPLMHTHPDDLPEVRQRIREVFNENAQQLVDFEHRILRVDGAVRWVRLYLQKVRYDEGEGAGDATLQCVFRDITEHKHSELRRISEALFTLYSEVFEIDPTQNACTLLASKVQSAQRVGQRTLLSADLDALCRGYALPEDREKFCSFFTEENLRKENLPKTMEYRYRLPGSDAVRYAACTALHLSGTAYLCGVLDVTEQKANEALLQSNASVQLLAKERLLQDGRERVLLQSGGLILCEYDPLSDEMTFLRGAEDGAAVQERTSRYMAGLPGNPHVSAEDRDRVLRALRGALEHASRLQFTYRSSRFGAFAPCRAHVESLADESGRVCRMVAAIQRLADADAAPETMRRQPADADALRDALLASPAYAYVVDADSCEVLLANAPVRDATGVSQPDAPCYRAYMGLDAPCENCPARAYQRLGVSVPSPVLHRGKLYLMQATPVRWQDKNAYVISGTDAALFADAPATLRQAALRDELARCVGMLSPLADELTLLDFAADVYQPLPAKGDAPRAQEGLSVLLQSRIAACANTDEQASLRAAFTPEGLQKLACGGTPALRCHITENGHVRAIAFSFVQLGPDRFLCCCVDETEKRRAALLAQECETLREQNRDLSRYRLVFERTGIAIFSMDFDTGRFYGSAAYQRYAMSYADQSAVFRNKGNPELVHPEDRDKLETFLRAGGGVNNHIETTLRLKMTDGSYRWTRMIGSLIRRPDGSVQQAVGTLMDVDEAMRTRESLRQLSERLSLIVENIPSGVGIYELKNGSPYPLYVSNQACRMFGYSREEYDMRIANGESVHFISTPATPADMERLRAGETLLLPRLHVQRKDGDWVWLSVSAHAQPQADDQLLLYTVFTDITQSIENQALIQTQHSELNAIIHSVPGGIFKYSAETDEFSYVSDTLLSMLGYTADEFTAKFHNRFSEMVWAEDRAAALQKIESDIARYGDIDSCEYRVETRSGHLKWVYDVGRLVTDAEGKQWYIVVVTDHDDQKSVESKLTTLNRQISALIQNTPGGITSFRISKNRWTLDYISEGFAALLGYDMPQVRALLENDVLSLIHPDEHDAVAEELRRVSEHGDSFSGQYRMRRQNGDYLWVAAQGSFAGEIGSGVYYLSYMDISEIKRMQEQLSHDKQQMETIVNSIPGGIATYAVQPDHLALLYASEGIAALSGRTPEQYRRLLNEEHGSDIYPQDQPMVMESIRQAVKNGQELDVNYRIVHQNGDLVWLNLRGRRTGERNGNPVFLAVYHNLSATTQLYQHILAQTDVALMVADTATKEVLYVNAAAEKLSGISSRAAAGMPCYRYLPHRDRPCEYCGLDHLTEGGFSYETRAENGRYLRVRQAHIDWNGHDAFISYITDVTAEKLTQQKIDSVIHNIPGGLAVYKVTQDGVTRTYLSDTAKRILQYQPGDHPGTDVDSVMGRVHPDDVPKLQYAIREATEQKEVFRLEHRIVDADAQIHWVSLIANPVVADDGALYFYGIYTDITEQKLAQQRVEAQRAAQLEKYRSELKNLSATSSENLLAKLYVDLTTGEVINLWVNPEECVNYEGLSYDAIVESLAATALNKNDRQRLRDKLDVRSALALLKGRDDAEVSLEYARKNVSGRTCWVQTTAKAFRDPETSHVMAFLFTYDIDQDKMPAVLTQRMVLQDVELLGLINVSTGLMHTYISDPPDSPRDGDYADICHAFVNQHVESDHREEALLAMDLGTVRQRLAQTEVTYRCAYWCMLNGQRVHKSWAFSYLDESQSSIILMRTDTTITFLAAETNRRALQTALEVAEVAMHDDVTHLLNRAATVQAIKERLNDPKIEAFALMMLDLDDLKHINDSFGHPMGDWALANVADTLRRHFRASDIVGRIGGDEFMVFLSGAKAEAPLRRSLTVLQQKVGRLFIDGRKDQPVHCSIGATLGRHGESDFEALYQQADAALYRAKQGGKNTYHFYAETDTPPKA